MKILTVVGARPQFIKASAVSRAIKLSSVLNEVVIHTGQHYDSKMSQVFFDELNIPKPQINLNIGNLSHGEMTGKQIIELERIMIDQKPDLVVVYGDTNSTAAGALAAVKLQIPIAHIEAGLRSFNKKMPEEINRIITDSMSDYLFTPSLTATENLIREGVNENNIFELGDVMYDSIKYFYKYKKRPKQLEEKMYKKDSFVLVTLHRQENVDKKYIFQNLIEGISAANEHILMPLHPRTKKIIENQNIVIPSNISIMDPVSYLEMIWLIDHCKFIATDSGGLQKEAYFMKKYCITLREETEWTELVSSGWNILVGSDKEKIRGAFINPLTLTQSNNIYGTGDSSTLIVNKIEELLL